MVNNFKYVYWGDACDQHDLDYANLNMTKNEADKRLYNNMIKAGAPQYVAWLYYQAVQEWGQPYWEDAQLDARLRANQRR